MPSISQSISNVKNKLCRAGTKPFKAFKNAPLESDAYREAFLIAPSLIWCTCGLYRLGDLNLKRSRFLGPTNAHDVPGPGVSLEMGYMIEELKKEKRFHKQPFTRVASGQVATNNSAQAAQTTS
jgi:hypothetical protein